MNTPVAVTAPWAFSPSTPTPGLWSVAGFTFDLLSSTVTQRTASSLTEEGSGIASGNGFDPTAMTWAFTTQNAGGAAQEQYSHSRQTAMPFPMAVRQSPSWGLRLQD